jgi:hypothetical protein
MFPRRIPLKKLLLDKEPMVIPQSYRFLTDHEVNSLAKHLPRG